MTVLAKFTDEYLLGLLSDGLHLQQLYSNELRLYECISLVIQLSHHEVAEKMDVSLDTIAAK